MLQECGSAPPECAGCVDYVPCFQELASVFAMCGSDPCSSITVGIPAQVRMKFHLAQRLLSHTETGHIVAMHGAGGDSAIGEHSVLSARWRLQ